jgi:hypothetical protein
MTVRHPKYQQGRKPTRIKPIIPVPLQPTGAHLKIDKVLTRAERREVVEEQRKAHDRAVKHANEVHKRAMKAYRQAHYKPPRQSHRHNFKKLLRVNPENGNRVVACNCGEYTIVPGVSVLSSSEG